MYLDHIKSHFAQLHIIHPHTLRPCTVEEVQTLEKWVGFLLPAAYKEFLLWMGHGAGFLLAGSDCFYYHLVNIQEAGRNLLEENAFPERLPDDAFVFFMHQGYNYGFFRISEGNDPPVYWYDEMKTQNSFSHTYAHYSDFLSKEIECHAELIAQFAARYPDPKSARSWMSKDLIESIAYYLTAR